MVAEYSVAVGLFRIFEHNQDEEHFWIRFVTINLESQYIPCFYLINLDSKHFDKRSFGNIQ